MSTATVGRMEVSRWNGYDDPGLPYTTWQGQVTAVGDISGGFTTCELLFKIATQPIDGIFYSIEQVMVLKTFAGAPVSEVAEVTTNNMGVIVPGRILTQRFWSLPLLAHPATNVASAQFGNQNRPIFLGSAHNVALQGSVSITAANPGAGEALRIHLEGFAWMPGAVLAPGGLRRPIDALFGV